MSFARYPSYKDSGVEWLGTVPRHWGISRLGFETWIRARLGWKGLKAEEYVDDGFAFLSTPNIKGLDIDFEHVNFITQVRFDESPEIKICEGDVLLAKDGSTLGTVNVVRSLPRPTTVNSSIAVITPNASLNSIYLYYLFASSYMEQTIQRTKGGMGVPHLFQADLNKFYMPLPALVEQTQIAAFLDRETAKIDALVAEQRRLMALLKEKRQTIISHAVTRGLNSDAPMKPSGIEWLGDVPAHWEIINMAYILDAIGDVDHFMPASVEKGVPYLMTGDLKEYVSEVCLDNCKQVSHDKYWQLSKKIKNSKGDVILARYATIGTLMYVDIDVDFLVSYSCVTLKTDNSKVSGFYLFHYMKSNTFRCGVENQINTNTQGNVGIKDLQNVKIAMPPIDEQIAIAAFLGSETTKFDTLTAEAQRAIDLLQERRTALISAAVTGQIDVRSAVVSA